MPRSGKRQLGLPGAEKASARDYFEKKWRARGFGVIAGVDEAGRGPLAGPVVAGAVILPEKIPASSPLLHLKDSKLLRPEKRDELYSLIEQHAVVFSVGMCSAGEIDELNILQASLLAMSRAVNALEVRPDLCLVDGNTPLECEIPSKAIKKGDLYCLSIAAGSIVAKVTRDRLMDSYHDRFPVYNFRSNKGYACREHKQAIMDHGPCPIHRKTFRGVREYI